MMDSTNQTPKSFHFGKGVRVPIITSFQETLGNALATSADPKTPIFIFFLLLSIVLSLL
jgi:hypothetical protein